MKYLWHKNGFFMICALLMLAAVAPAQTVPTSTTHQFSLQQVVDYAGKHNMNIQTLLLDVKTQQQVNREVTANAYPQISGVLGTTYNAAIATQVIPDFISPATYGVLVNEGVKDGNGNTIQMPSSFSYLPAQFGTKFSANIGVSLQQILFDGQVFIGLQAREATIAFKEKNVEVAVESIKANLHKIYYQLIVANTQVELLDANITRLEKLQHDTKLIYDNGFAEKVDVDKVNVALTNLRTEKNKILNQISNGYYGLKLLMGMPVQDNLVLTDTLSFDQIKEGALELNNYNYSDRKEFQYLDLAQKLNEYNLRRYKLSKYPTVVLQGNYLKNAQRNQFNFLNRDKWFTISAISLNVSIPIFNGFSTDAKIEQVKLDIQKADLQREMLKQSIDNDVAVANNNFKSALLTLDAQKKNMDLAELVYNQTKKKYEVGTGSQTEITAAQTELKNAQTNYTSALYDAIIAKTDYLKATGKL